MTNELDQNQTNQAANQPEQPTEELSTEELDSISGGPIYMYNVIAQTLPAENAGPNQSIKFNPGQQH